MTKLKVCILVFFISFGLLACTTDMSTEQRALVTSDGVEYKVILPSNGDYEQQKWEKLVYKKEKLKDKINKNMIGGMLKHHEDEDEDYTFTLYHIKGKEDSVVKIMEQPKWGYIYVIPYESYVKYEEEAG